MHVNAIHAHGCSAAAGGVAVVPAWLNHLAHDLRGPLSPLANALALLRSGRLDASQQAETCSLAQQQLDALSQLLDDTADLLAAKPRSSAPVEIGSLFDMVKVRISRRLYAGNAALEITPPPVPLEVHGDMCGLVRLLVGLLLRSSAIAGVGCRLQLQIQIPDAASGSIPDPAWHERAASAQAAQAAPVPSVSALPVEAGPRIVIGVHGDAPQIAEHLAAFAATLTASSQIHVADAALARIVAAHGLLLRAAPDEGGGSLVLEWPRD
ncbi:histidine kinase dimerization/phospho-acceptor domain-containing protein [Tahibacter harae]|uniref:histidine kinase n=1 Tax=Tahibacter harae TaxID=2963937 RepID=A0ABT1QRY7_9GAMM|nr:histidine kinase dimerization/phospho-acceptor domain-containing protein [Tahibacter harae]MCQ4165039.1 hypothetical protein [Tahibacter harae]